MHHRKTLTSVIHEIFASTDKIFISGGGLSTRQQFWDFETFLILPNFLRSQVLIIQQPVTQLIYTSLLLIITLLLTFGGTKICSAIKEVEMLWTWMSAKFFLHFMSLFTASIVKNF